MQQGAEFVLVGEVTHEFGKPHRNVAEAQFQCIQQIFPECRNTTFLEPLLTTFLTTFLTTLLVQFLGKCHGCVLEFRCLY